MSFLSRENGLLSTHSTHSGKGIFKREDGVILQENGKYHNQRLNTAAAPSNIPDTWNFNTDAHVVDAKAKVSNRRCGVEGCASSWLKPWKSRKRPVFEGEWGCSSNCIQSLVRLAIRREAGDGFHIRDNAPHRHRVPLGLVLLAQGWITHPQLQTALEAQRKYGEGRIGDWLVHSCGLEQERVTRGLGVQWSAPVFTIDGFAPERMALVMPKRFICEFGLVPLRIVGSRMLYLGSETGMDASASLAVEHISGLKVEGGLVDTEQFSQVKTRVLASTAVPVTIGTMPDAEEITTQICKILQEVQPVASRLVRIHHYVWLRMWLEDGSFSGITQIPSSPEDVQDVVFSLA